MSRAENRRKARLSQRADRHRPPVTSRPAPAAGSAGVGKPLALAGVLLVALLLYLRCLANGFVFDDNLMVVKNAYIGSWSFFRISFANDSWWYLDPLHLPASSYYRPLQDAWLGVHFHLFGLNPIGWHATMVALNVLVVWLVFRLASRLTGDGQAALLAAALFAVLPFHAEAVVWVSAIPLPLGAAFELAALLLFIERAEAAYRNWALALMLYAGALLTHESAVVFPVLAALYAMVFEPPDRAVANRPALQRARMRVTAAVVSAAPFGAELLVYLLIRFLVLGFINRPMPVNHLSNGQALMTVAPVLIAYLGLLAMPWRAASAHHMEIVSSISSPEFWLSAGALIAIGAAFFVAVRNDRRRELYFFCAAWMAIAIAPMMNLRGIFQGSIVQDRYLYLPSVAWCVMLADWIVRVARSGTAARRTTAYAAIAVLLAVCAGALWNVQRLWHDDVTFYTTLIKENPDQPSWHYAFGVALRDRGDLAGARREFKAAVQLDPQSAALYDLGVVDSQLGDIKEAATEEAEGIKRIANPAADAYVGLAQIYDMNGDQAKSEAALKQAESLPNGAHVAALARAQSKYNHGDLPGAEAILRNLTTTDPYDPRAWTVLGMTAIREKNNDLALECFRQATALAPRDPFARVMTGLALHKLGRDQEALEQCRSALAIAPNDRNAQALIARIERETPSRQPSSTP